ncbi:YceI family protein [Dyella sp. S184]|uniref:YceI family protein n=1 Tax=Dyella sp. S184 TaxID=1641862 RepID=UPI00131DAF55|nr:YceI family protein [Dyella sp. S184]
MKSLLASFAIAVVSLLEAPAGIAMQASQSATEDAAALAQYKSLGLTKDPRAITAGEYKIDPHHTSVIAKLAHMDLSRYSLRFDSLSGGFLFDPSRTMAINLEISIAPQSVDTGDQAFDKKIAKRYFRIDQYPKITFSSSAVKIAGDHISVDGILDFHGVKKPLTLNVVYRGFAHGRMGFSGEATFKRSEFGVGEWAPLEADEVTLLIETEFVKT